MWIFCIMFFCKILVWFIFRSYIYPHFKSYGYFSLFPPAATLVSTAVTAISAWTPTVNAVSQWLPAAVCCICFLFLIWVCWLPCSLVAYLYVNPWFVHYDALHSPHNILGHSPEVFSNRKRIFYPLSISGVRKSKCSPHIHNQDTLQHRAWSEFHVRNHMWPTVNMHHSVSAQ